MASIWVKLAAVSAGAAVLAGCAGIRDHRGYILDKQLAPTSRSGSTIRIR